MTAVASAPTFSQISRPAWGSFSANNSMNPDEVRGGMDMFTQRKPPLARSNSSSSVSSTSSNSSTTTVATNGSQPNGTPLSVGSEASQWSANGAPRKRPQQQRGAWPPGKGEPPQELSRIPMSRSAGMAPSHGQMQIGPGQPQMAGQGMMRPMTAEQFAAGQPVLYLLSLNGTFDRKTIAVPFAPDSLRIGRQTNQKTIPTATNGFFDSKVLSRQHAEIWAERGSAKIFIRDVKSSNGTFVNGTRLSQENRESEPHELQTADHLELGIDIVSEDQKTVVHHKVAAKVEHAGLLNSSNNVMDMNFGELDPANSSMMMPPGPMQMRGRNGNPSMPNNGRMMFNGMAINPQPQPNAMPQQRPFFLTPVATDQILKRLANEMRSARLQAQDLGRTNHFINTLLSKEDIKDLEKPEAPEPPKSQLLVNGNGIPFRTDPKTRFSDPPAPPPQQPLPEKPDVPSLKRGPTERPKLGPATTSPTRQDNLNQIIQLTEALNSARRDIDSQTTRMRELEELLQKERSAREEAEDLAKRLEETVSIAHVNGKPVQQKGSVREAINHAFRSYEDREETNEDESPEEKEKKPSEADIAAQEMATALQSRIDSMDTQMLEMKQQMEEWKQRCEAAESERDADRKTLAEMVIQLRAEEAQRKAAQRARSQSRQRRVEAAEAEAQAQAVVEADAAKATVEDSQVDGSVASDQHMEKPTLSRTNTITPYTSQKTAVAHDNPLQMGLPYASMLGVVLVGMGLMAYLNGWQSPPPRLEQ